MPRNAAKNSFLLLAVHLKVSNFIILLFIVLIITIKQQQMRINKIADTCITLPVIKKNEENKSMIEFLLLPTDVSSVRVLPSFFQVPHRSD